jgi:hypothetical protein
MTQDPSPPANAPSEAQPLPRASAAAPGSQWLQLAIYAVLLAIVALLGFEFLGQSRSDSSGTQDGALAVLSPDGGESTPQDELQAGLGFTSYSFGPLNEYRIDLPGGGGVISTGDSDWPQDERIQLVWHGYTNSPIGDIVVRISRLPSASQADFEAWLSATQAALEADMANKPEGKPSEYGLDGRNWHNLPFSYASTQNPGQREALDFNATQFGIDAVSVSFYFPLPPAQGVLEQVVPMVLHSVGPILAVPPGAAKPASQSDALYSAP